MSCLSTFGAFTTARLAIYASQKALDVVGNNIGNINTTGYTRQYVDQVSFISGHADRYHTALDNRVGNGALVTGISQLRDPYLDIRYRNEMASVGYREEVANGYTQLANILDEVAKGENDSGELGVIEKQFNDLIEQMQNLVDKGAGLDTYDTNVRTSAASLTRLLNSAANSLQNLYEAQEGKLKTDVDDVNSILTQIRELNNTIRKSDIYGGDGLELRDTRNNLIDELSRYMRIDVSYELEDFGPGQKVEKLVIRLDNNDLYDIQANQYSKKDKDIVLIDGIYGAQISVDHAKEDPTGTKKYVDAEGNPVDDINKADREFNANYQILVSKLTDSHNRVKSWYEQEEQEVKVPDPNDPSVTITVKQKVNVKKESQPVLLSDNAIYGSLQAQRELLTEQGEYSTKEQLKGNNITDPLVKHIDADPNANTKRGIKYYQKALDTLANQFANIMNEANVVGPTTLGEAELDQLRVDPGKKDSKISVKKLLEFGKAMKGPDGTIIHFETLKKDGKEYFQVIDGCALAGNSSLLEIPQGANDDATIDQEVLYHVFPSNYTINGQACLEHGVYSPPLYQNNNTTSPTGQPGPLFSNSGNGNETAGITAANISISKAWAEGTVRMQQSKDPDHPSTDNSNLDHFLYILQGQSHNFKPTGTDLTFDEEPDSKTVFFSGTFQEMFTENICGTLAMEQKSNYELLENHSVSADGLYVDRDAVSGVDLNDEAMNMMQFQKSLNAAFRLMTVIDETLDRLISNTGIVGR